MRMLLCERNDVHGGHWRFTPGGSACIMAILCMSLATISPAADNQPKAGSTTGSDVAKPDDGYRIRPLDTIIVDTLNNASQRQELTVEPNGNVALGVECGRAKVGGLTISEAERVLNEKMATFFKDSRVQVTLAPAIWRERLLESQKEQMLDERDKLRQIILDQTGLSPETVSVVLASLEKDCFDLEVELNVKTMTRDRLTQMLALADQTAAEKLKSDEVSVHMQKMIDARKALAAHQAEGGHDNQIPELEVQRAQLALLEAESQLATRQYEVRRTNEVSAIQQKLADISMSLPQDEARLALLRQKLDRIHRARNLVDSYSRLNDFKLPEVSHALEKGRNDYWKSERNR